LIAKSVLNFLLVAAIAYGALVALMYFAQRPLMYPGASIAGAAPQTPPWGELAMLDTPDGERLFALQSHAEAGRPTIVFFHGNADRITQYGFLAHGLAARGIGLLALSYRGFTGSTGSPTEEGLLTDGLTAHDWLVERADGPVVLLGQSLGSGVAVHLARERPDVAGLILVSAYDSIVNLAASIYFFLPVRPLIKDRFRSDLWIGDVKQPKLFVHGQHDAVIPIRHGQALYELAPEPKRMLVYDAHGHNDIWGEGLLGDVLAFVESLEGR
jgi:uncharacterized protein